MKWFKKLSQRFKTTTVVLYSYETILLTTYQEIAQTGNIGLLIVSGKPSEKALSEQWENIVSRNGHTNGFNAEDYHDNIKDYVRLLSTYQGVQASLLQLCLQVDEDAILFLNSKGYQIDTSSHSAYQHSIQNALQKCKNVITKINSKHNIITQYLKHNEENVTPLKTSVEEMLAVVSSQLGFSVGSDVTLARYNEYNRIIKKRIEASKMRKAS